MKDKELTLLKCRICKVPHVHKLIDEFKNLPPNVGVYECLGCGILGVVTILNEIK